MAPLVVSVRLSFATAVIVTSALLCANIPLKSPLVNLTVSVGLFVYGSFGFHTK